jgi:hypothetical protein
LYCGQNTVLPLLFKDDIEEIGATNEIKVATKQLKGLS